MSHSVSDLLAFLSLGTGIAATFAVPFLLWVNADYLLVADWQVVGDRLLVESRRAVDAACVARRRAALSTAALLLLLSTPTTEVTR